MQEKGRGERKGYVKGFENPRAKAACHNCKKEHVSNTGFKLFSKVETNQPSTPKQ